MLLTKGKKYQIMLEWDKCSISNPFITPVGMCAGLLTITSEELVEAITTCGIPWFNDIPCIRKRRERELHFKYDLIEFALIQDVTTHRIILNESAFSSLDPSEKAIVSYYLGMFFTKLISKKIFNIDYLVHLKVAEKYTSVVYKTKERPDFIGFTRDRSGNNQYSLFEAKGRLNKVVSTLEKAVDQLNAVSYVSGMIPSPRVVSMVHFKKGRLIMTIVDPSDIENEDSIEIDKNGIIEAYYRPILELIHEEKNVETDQSVERVIHMGEGVNIKIMLKKDYMNYIEKADSKNEFENTLSVEFV